MMHYVVLFTVCILVFIFSKSMKATMWALFFFLVGLVCLLVEQPMWGGVGVSYVHCAGVVIYS